MGVLFGEQVSQMCVDYKERGLQLYSPRQVPRTTTDRVLHSATHVAKNMVASYLLATKPTDPFHTKAIELMHCFQDIRFKYTHSVAEDGEASTVVAHVIHNHSFRRPNIILYDEFFHINRRQQAITILHECSHLYNGSSDQAYFWDPLFAKLKEHQHLSNADSIAGKMSNPYI